MNFLNRSFTWSVQTPMNLCYLLLVLAFFFFFFFFLTKLMFFFLRKMATSFQTFLPLCTSINLAIVFRISLFCSDINPIPFWPVSCLIRLILSSNINAALSRSLSTSSAYPISHFLAYNVAAVEQCGPNNR